MKTPDPNSPDSSVNAAVDPFELKLSQIVPYLKNDDVKYLDKRKLLNFLLEHFNLDYRVKSRREYDKVLAQFLDKVPQVFPCIDKENKKKNKKNDIKVKDLKEEDIIILDKQCLKVTQLAANIAANGGNKDLDKIGKIKKDQIPDLLNSLIRYFEPHGIEAQNQYIFKPLAEGRESKVRQKIYDAMRSKLNAQHLLMKKLSFKGLREFFTMLLDSSDTVVVANNADTEILKLLMKYSCNTIFEAIGFFGYMDISRSSAGGEAREPSVVEFKNFLNKLKDIKIESPHGNMYNLVLSLKIGIENLQNVFNYADRPSYFGNYLINIYIRSFIKVRELIESQGQNVEGCDKSNFMTLLPFMREFRPNEFLVFEKDESQVVNSGYNRNPLNVNYWISYVSVTTLRANVGGVHYTPYLLMPKPTGIQYFHEMFLKTKGENRDVPSIRFETYDETMNAAILRELNTVTFYLNTIQPTRKMIFSSYLDYCLNVCRIAALPTLKNLKETLKSPWYDPIEMTQDKGSLTRNILIDLNTHKNQMINSDFKLNAGTDRASQLDPKKYYYDKLINFTQLSYVRDPVSKMPIVVEPLSRRNVTRSYQYAKLITQLFNPEKSLALGATYKELFSHFENYFHKAFGQASTLRDQQLLGGDITKFPDYLDSIEYNQRKQGFIVKSTGKKLRKKDVIDNILNYFLFWIGLLIAFDVYYETASLPPRAFKQQLNDLVTEIRTNISSLAKLVEESSHLFRASNNDPAKVNAHLKKLTELSKTVFFFFLESTLFFEGMREQFGSQMHALLMAHDDKYAPAYDNYVANIYHFTEINKYFYLYDSKVQTMLFRPPARANTQANASMIMKEDDGGDYFQQVYDNSAEVLNKTFTFLQKKENKLHVGDRTTIPFRFDFLMKSSILGAHKNRMMYLSQFQDLSSHFLDYHIVSRALPLPKTGLQQDLMNLKVSNETFIMALRGKLSKWYGLF